MNPAPVRLRIAPSPTGYLHIGNVRSALFNWLYARRHGGVFIVRVDDTDRRRSDDRYIEDIVGGFRWLGLDWDEGIEVGGAARDLPGSRTASTGTGRWPNGSSTPATPTTTSAPRRS